MTYNYGDPLINSLIPATHFPVEFTIGGQPPPNPQSLSLLCAKCYNPWPCQTILDYRAYAQAHEIPLASLGQGLSSLPGQSQFLQSQGQLIPPRLP